VKPDSLPRRVLAGLFDIGPPSALDLRPPATAEYSLTRRALAGVLGVTLPERTGGDSAGLRGAELTTRAPVTDDLRVRSTPEHEADSAVAQGERPWVPHDRRMLVRLALVALLPVMTVLAFGHVTIDAVLVSALLIAMAGVLVIARSLVVSLQARDSAALHRQAVRMTAEQATLQSNINALFVNLSRRSQALVERQLSLIDRLEQDEQDPDQLASLFELDHLATRMRRNSENLLVLSGTGLPRQLSRPASVTDVVGAAVSEVEHYARIEVASAPDVAVQGRAVSDLVHVIAELLDNATFFSPEGKKVIVRTAMTRRKELAIQITDQGVGMSEEEIKAANAHLADPPGLDVAATGHMGLYVVAHLAKRHGIAVRMRHNENIGGGLIARINVPAELVLPMTAELRARPPAPGGEFTTPPPQREPEPAARLPVYPAVLSQWLEIPDSVRGNASAVPESTTNAGLPKRVPGRQPLPEAQEPTPGDEGPPPLPRSPEAVRRRMSSFQHGVERARRTSEVHAEEAHADESAHDHE
jgi:signal transduction histidine kinase